jgi:NAD(P)-dependent dehydrogenase (short-subunit alcohol dehydrogenase family)
MEIEDKVAVITGAASGIGSAVCEELARRGAKYIAMVDMSPEVVAKADEVNRNCGRVAAHAFQGDVTRSEFRSQVFDTVCEAHQMVNICVPAAGIVRDSLAVKVNRTSGAVEMYPVDVFRQVTEVNLIAPVYWAIETVYASTKAGLEGAAATLMKEAIFHGVRCGVIHPGFTDTPILGALGDEFVEKHVLPETQLGRLIRPEEIADAICFMISNQAVSGELWADAGWHPAAA